MATRTSRILPELRNARLADRKVLLPLHGRNRDSSGCVLCRSLRDKIEVEVIVFNTRSSTVREEVDGIRVTRYGELFRFAANSVSLTMPAELSRREFDIVHLHVPNPLAA